MGCKFLQADKRRYEVEFERLHMKKKKMRRRQIIGKMLAFVLTASILLGNNSLLVLAQEGTSAPIEVTTVDAGEDKSTSEVVTPDSVVTPSISLTATPTSTPSPTATSTPIPTSMPTPTVTPTPSPTPSMRLNSLRSSNGVSNGEGLITTQPSAINVDYNGKNHTLQVEVSSEIKGTPSYQWYIKKDGETDFTEINGATAKSYNVKNVADSGTYYVEVTIPDTEGVSSVTEKSSEVTVNIKRIPLTITAEDKTIGYGSSAPTYTYSASGFLAGENAESAGLEVGTYVCGYNINDAIGNYDIVPSDFSAPNYSISHVKGTLTIEKTNVSVVGSPVTIELAEDTDTYSGTACTPAVTVKNGTNIVADSEYTVSYRNNIDAGTGTEEKSPQVKITFKNYYEGELTQYFTINPVEITLESNSDTWEYDGNPHFNTNYSIKASCIL